ncbi:hypothetical protein M408DRAFT_233960 [Serendipita vermifera MAFF 305830]|uniref:DUF6533 domain-containing protein n=1 Tax=Serendipita vermifera MAFF 305830 TaxID=933852 RepID=A0A0C2WCT8_SERVB|nr:hypothetical protein M408DRAFT_233960 [Serendipita vermifera MAFF 305830]
MSTMLPFEVAAALATAVADLVTTGRYCTLAAWVMMLYDHIIHFDKEVELFWGKPWSAAKCLYFFNRYVSPVFLGVHAMIFLSPHVTDSLCLSWFKFEGYTGTISIASVEMILGFRVFALWNRNKWIAAMLVFALLAEVAAMLTILTSTYVNMLAVSAPDPSIPYRACIPLNVSLYFFTFWIPPLAYESLVFILAAIKGFNTLRNNFSSGNGEFTIRSTGSRLLEVMIRDSLWYFLLIFTCDMVCSLIWLKGPESLLQAVAGFGLAMPSIAGSHLLLNLRDAYYHPAGSVAVTTAQTTGWAISGNVHAHGIPTSKGGTTAPGNSRYWGKKHKAGTFGRSRNILASGGRHQVGQLDTQWALDPEQDDITTFQASGGGLNSEMENELYAKDDDETLPTGSQRTRGGSTIKTTATISTLNHVDANNSSARAPAPGDVYAYTTRRLPIGGGPSDGGGSTYGMETGIGITSPNRRPQRLPPAGEGEEYELQHVPVRAGTTG